MKKMKSKKNLLIEEMKTVERFLKLWIARDEDGSLFLYTREPYLVERITGKEWSFKEWSGDIFAYLPKESFPEVTFENSPQKIFIIL